MFIVTKYAALINAYKNALNLFVAHENLPTCTNH